MKPLPPGGTIGVAAPASPYDARSEVLRGVEWWQAQGYRVKLADGVFARDDYVAGDAKQRAADLNALFADPEVDVVQALQGGYGSAQTIPYLDFDAIAANPKSFVGFSDCSTGLREAGLGILMITHDLSTAARFADRIAVMYLGRIVEEGPAEAVVRDPQHPYTKALLSVVPRRDARERLRPQILTGEAPDAIRIPRGCRFHPRCPVAIADCREIDPALERHGAAPGHRAACILAG
jgi:oligopeptide/dipeptide ABC transporter ATP-binding protein